MPSSSRSALVVAALLAAACAGTTADPVSVPTTTPGTPTLPGVAVLRGDVTASRVLSADTTYVLSGAVRVTAGATLTIPAGTTLVGDSLVRGSALWILRGARIDARGTATRPIVFTSQHAPGTRSPGDWGGVVVLGNAPTSGGAAGQYGGNAPNDDSGALSYVRIEFAGRAPADGVAPNAALSLYAVGRGTTLDHVQSLESLGGGVRWIGGTVDGHYLVSYEAGDDHFAWSDGYTGRDQFLIGYQTQQTAARGLSGAGRDASALVAPYSAPVIANFTLVGAGAGVSASDAAAQSGGIVLRAGTGATLLNGVVAHWPGVGLGVRDALTDSLRRRDSLFVAGVLLTDNAGGNYDAVQGGGFGQESSFPMTASAATPTSTLFNSVPSSAVPVAEQLDWLPAGGSPLRANGFTAWSTRVLSRTAGFVGGMAITSYMGAADPNSVSRWWQGWTAYRRS